MLSAVSRFQPRLFLLHMPARLQYSLLMDSLQTYWHFSFLWIFPFLKNYSSVLCYSSFLWIFIFLLWIFLIHIDIPYSYIYFSFLQIFFTLMDIPPSYGYFLFSWIFLLNWYFLIWNTFLILMANGYFLC